MAREAEQREARAKQVLANRELKLAQEKARKVLAEVTTTHPSRPRTQAVFLDCFCAPIRIVVSESSPFTRWAFVGRRRRRTASSGRRRRRRTVRSTSAPTRGWRSTQSDTGSSAPRPSPSSTPQHSGFSRVLGLVNLDVLLSAVLAMDAGLRGVGTSCGSSSAQRGCVQQRPWRFAWQCLMTVAAFSSFYWSAVAMLLLKS